MITQKKEKMLWISNVLPIEIADKLKLSIAGKKMDINMISSFSKLIDIDVLSVSDISDCSIETMNLINDLEYHQISREPGNYIIMNRKKEKKIKQYLTNWCEQNSDFEKYILITNYPLTVCRPVISVKKKYNVKVFSFVEDYFSLDKANGIKNKILNFYNSLYFNKGIKLLSKFNGIIVLNENVCNYVNNKTFYKTMIGVERDCFFGKPTYFNHPIKIAFAGTLINSNGIATIMKTFKALPQNEFELHIFGFGPLENDVSLFCHEHRNAFFHGQINSELITRELSNMDILINLLPVERNRLMDFNFPSKIVDYICSGSIIITTKFSGFPEDYKNFVYITKSDSSDDLLDTILLVSKEKQSKIMEKCYRGQKFIRDNQQYDVLTNNIMVFMRGVK